jgi:septum formation protein
MLAAAGIPFSIADTEADEASIKAALKDQEVGAIPLALALAEAKARGVAAQATDLVLGSDQTLERDDGTLLDKPGSRADALDQLRSLSGRTHRLHSAAAIVENGALTWSSHETVELRMRELSEPFLEAYLDGHYENVRWSVGCYHVEGAGVQLFDRIEGSHFAILGLPLLPLLGYLRSRSILPG